MRQKIEIAVATLAVLAYLLLLPAALGSFCSIPREGGKPVAYRFSINGQSQEHTSPQIDKGAVVPAHISELRATGSAYPSQSTVENPESWWSKFWCEVNASDWFIGLFTLFLAIATYFLWRETERLAKGGDEQAQRMVDGINATIAVVDKTKDVANAMAEAAQAMPTVAGISDAAMQATEKEQQARIEGIPQC